MTIKYCIIYRFVVKPDQFERFQTAWSEVTRAYMEHSGGLGSRLHHRGGNEYIAYAQWPDRETRERSDLPESIKDGASKIMRDCCETIETLYELTPVADYLIPANVKDR